MKIKFERGDNEVLMYKYKNYYITGSLVTVILIIFILVIGCSFEESIDNELNLPNSRVESIEDVSYGNIKRFAWHVVVYEPINEDQFILLSEKYVEHAKARESFNAIFIFFYDYSEYIGHGYTLGRAEFGPDGKWGEAHTVRTGQYEKMKLVLDFRNKDWSKQLTPDEVKIWTMWMETSDLLIKDGLFPDDEEVDKIVASEFGVDPDEINSIIWKQLNWTFLNE